MLQLHSLSEQSRFSKLFATLHLGKTLRQAGTSKSFGLSSLAIVQIIFSLVFEGKNWFRLLESDGRADFPGKDVVYRLVFIVDDSVLSRNRSKKTELLARVFNHSTGTFTKGYTMLTLGWSVAPLEFVMLSSAQLANRLCDMASNLSKRSSLLERALRAGFTADHVLYG